MMRSISSLILNIMGVKINKNTSNYLNMLIIKYNLIM